jgi:phosphatidylethanolamine-binding protein
MPPLNDIPHTYTFYLFDQPANFSLPVWDAGRDYFDARSMDRMNFSVHALADVAGAPIAANYIRVQNPGNNATGTLVPNTCPSSNGTSGSNGSSTVAPPGATTGPVPFDGAAVRGVQYSMGAAMLVVATLAFEML